ncbi:MAG: hypothetical protein V4608_02710 [Bacteroidota bacterium]
MNHFEDRYKTISNSDLLKILDTPTDYQPLAVEAAKSEFARRQLSETEIETVKASLAIQREEMEARSKKKKNIENKVKDLGASVIDNINPIQTTTRTTEKTILILCIVLGGLSIKKFYNEFGMLQFMFTDSEAKWNVSMLLYFFPLVILPLGTFLFWKRKKIGWTLLAIYLSYVSIGSIISFIVESNSTPSSFSALENLVPKTFPLVFIWSLIFNGGMLWVICKDNIREALNINKRKIFVAIGTSIALTALTMVGIFM